MPENILIQQLRPRRFSELYGQDATVAAIRRHMTKRPPRAWLFSGSSGCGKTTLARIMAHSLQCTHQKEFGEPCDACCAAKWAIHEINASMVNGVEEIEKVARMASFASVSGGLRVIILDEVQRVTSASQNLLLKPTEDVPPHVVWIICTTEPNKLLPTLRRRFTSYTLKQLSVTDAETFLRETAKRVGIVRPLDKLIEVVSQAGIGSPAMLLQTLEKYAAGATSADAVSGTDAPSVNTLAICRGITAGNWPEVRKALTGVVGDEARWVRSSVCGWLKGCLARETNPKRVELISTTLFELTGMAPLEDAMLLSWLWAVLCRGARRLRT
jgi:DNA polymerase-3 subunit gamma/tau